MEMRVVACFNPLAGIRCFLTSPTMPKADSNDTSFNPLAGIRCFLTDMILVREKVLFVMGFNPLAGIRCFLTNEE